MEVVSASSTKIGVLVAACENDRRGVFYPSLAPATRSSKECQFYW